MSTISVTITAASLDELAEKIEELLVRMNPQDNAVVRVEEPAPSVFPTPSTNEGPRKRGRRTKAEVEAAKKVSLPEEDTAVVAEEPVMEMEDEGDKVTAENVREQMRAVNNSLGYDTLMSLLKQVGATKFSDIKESEYVKFIGLCKTAIATA